MKWLNLLAIALMFMCLTQDVRELDFGGMAFHGFLFGLNVWVYLLC